MSKKFECYTIDMVKEMLLKCGSKSEFQRKHYRLYVYCKKKGWLDELNSFLPRKKKWTLDTLKEEALKYKTRIEFMSKNVSAYNVALKSGHYDEIVSHMGNPNKFKPKTKWTYDNLKEIYLGCKTLKEVRTKYGQKVILAAQKNGWHEELSNHFTKDPHPNLYWTFDRVKEEAEKYKSRKEFGLNCPSAYQRAITMEWMDVITTHMEKGYTKWTKEKMMEIISGCKSMKDVKEKSPALFVYIKRHKLQEELFKN